MPVVVALRGILETLVFPLRTELATLNSFTIGKLRCWLVCTTASIALLIIGIIGCGDQDASSSVAAEPTASTTRPQTVVPATATPQQMSPTPVPATATPVPTATPIPPTPTPAPRAILQAAPGKTPADYTADDLRKIAIAITQEFYAAITSQPEPDLSRDKKTYSEACQPEDDDEFAAQIDALLELLDGRQLSVEVLDVVRLPDTDDAVIALSIGLIDGERVAGATRSLIVFENGRWVDSDCDAGRALVIGGGSSGGVATPAPAQPAATAAPSTSSPLPSIASATVFVAEGDPGDHTDEQIARSVEYVTKAAWLALLADPPLDMEAIRGLSVQSCQEQTDEELIEFAKTMRSQIGDSEVENVVQAVERVDRTRAWTSGHVEMDGIIFSEVTPTLVAFEDGQWRDADCLTDEDTSLKRPDQIDPDVRVSYIGEPVEMQHDWEEPPYEIIVLAPPEMVDDDTARLAVRVTAITDVLNVEDVYFSGWLSTGFDAGGNAVEWWAAHECESNAFEPATLAMGGSQEGFVCFAFDEFSDSEGRPSDDRPFVLFQSIHGDDLVTVDLTKEVLPPAN